MLIVTGVERGCTADLAQFLSGRLVMTGDNVTCHMLEAASLRLGPRFKIYLISRCTPLRNSSLTSAIAEKGFENGAGFKKHFLPTSAFRNITIVNFCGAASISDSKLVLPLPDQVNNWEGELSGFPGALPAKSKGDGKHFITLRSKKSLVFSDERATCLRSSLVARALNLAWDDSHCAALPKARATLCCPREVIGAYRKLFHLEDEIVGYLVSLQKPCEAGKGLIHWPVGGEQTIMDVLKGFRVSLATVHLRIQSAHLQEKRLMNMQRVILSMADDFMEASRTVYSGLQVTYGVSFFSRISSLSLHDCDGFFGRALSRAGSDTLESVREASGDAAKVKCFTIALIEGSKMVSRFKKRKQQRLLMANATPSTPFLPQRPKGSPDTIGGRPQLRNVKRNWEGRSSGITTPQVTDLLQEYFWEMYQSTHPEFHWVATMAYLYCVQQRAWGLAEPDWWAFLSLLQAFTTPSYEASLICVGKQGKELVWLSESVLDTMRHKSESSACDNDDHDYHHCQPEPFSEWESTVTDHVDKDAAGSGGDEHAITSCNSDEQRASSTLHTLERVPGRFQRQLFMASLYAVFELLDADANIESQEEKDIETFLFTTRSLLDSLAYPSLLHKNTRGRKIWRQVIMLEGWNPNMFQGLVSTYK